MFSQQNIHPILILPFSKERDLEEDRSIGSISNYIIPPHHDQKTLETRFKSTYRNAIDGRERVIEWRYTSEQIGTRVRILHK